MPQLVLGQLAAGGRGSDDGSSRSSAMPSPAGPGRHRGNQNLDGRFERQLACGSQPSVARGAERHGISQHGKTHSWATVMTRPPESDVPSVIGIGRPLLSICEASDPTPTAWHNVARRSADGNPSVDDASSRPRSSVPRPVRPQCPLRPERSTRRRGNDRGRHCALICGVRPNSPIHRIVVESRRPRSARSFINVAQPASSSAERVFTALKLSVCVSQPAPPLLVPSETSTTGDAAFDQATGHQASLAEHRTAVLLAKLFRFGRQIEGLWHPGCSSIARPGIDRVVGPGGRAAIGRQEIGLQALPHVQTFVACGIR